MTQQLSQWQVNNLLTGTSLAAELPATSESRRAFLVVGGYLEDTERSRALGFKVAQRPSRFLNADHSDMRFEFRIFEIEKQYIEHPDLTDAITTHEQDFADKSDISSLAQLEGELAQHLDDFSVLDVLWKVIPYF